MTQVAALNWQANLDPRVVVRGNLHSMLKWQIESTRPNFLTIQRVMFFNPLGDPTVQQVEYIAAHKETPDEGP
jgi:hypothetical protein